jgi:hypothetical protein
MTLAGLFKTGGLEIKQYTEGLVYVDDVNILGGGVHTIEKNIET